MKRLGIESLSSQYSLRDLLHSRYRSSTKAKKIRRKEVTVQMDDAVGFILSNEDVARRMKHVTKEARRGGKFLSSRQEQIFVVARGCMCS
jgi:hypothetical protein